MTTVVIAAHNEDAVLGAALDALLAEARPGELEVIVSANGCTDDTAAVARSRPGVVVVDSPKPGKSGALNRAERVATSFPRVYLDADIPVTTETIRELCAAVNGDDGVLVATPGRILDTTARPLVVRAYFAIHRHLPVFDEALMGRGLIVLSREGRSRFEQFPEVVADDLFLDSLFTSAERVRLPHLTTTVATPRRTRDLVRRLVRVRRGNAALRASQSLGPAVHVRRADRTSWLRDVLAERPALLPAAVVYVAVTAWAALLARRGPVDATTWGRDDSTRTPSRAEQRPMSSLINLCFHGIGAPRRTTEPGEDAYWISRDLYHRVLDLAAEDPRVRLSFDDGNASDLEIGLPALLDRSLDATFFVLAARLDQPGSLSGDDVRALADAGMGIGTHGMDHRPWRGLDEGSLGRELVEARQRLVAETGAAVDEAALPLGRYDRRLLARVRELGYTRLYTSDRTWARSAAWLQPRFSIRQSDTVETVRSQMLTRAPRLHRLRRSSAMTVKRLR